MVTRKGMLRVNCLDLGDKLAERLLVEFQDTSKVTHYYVNDLGGKYSMSHTASVPTTIHPNYIFQYSDMLYHTWVMLLCM